MDQVLEVVLEVVLEAVLEPAESRARRERRIEHSVILWSPFWERVIVPLPTGIALRRWWEEERGLVGY